MIKAVIALCVLFISLPFPQNQFAAECWPALWNMECRGSRTGHPGSQFWDMGLVYVEMVLQGSLVLQLFEFAKNSWSVQAGLVIWAFGTGWFERGSSESPQPKWEHFCRLGQRIFTGSKPASDLVQGKKQTTMTNTNNSQKLSAVHPKHSFYVVALRRQRSMHLQETSH